MDAWPNFSRYCEEPRAFCLDLLMKKNLAGGDAAEDALGDDYDMPVIVKVRSMGELQ